HQSTQATKADGVPSGRTGGAYPSHFDSISSMPQKVSTIMTDQVKPIRTPQNVNERRADTATPLDAPAAELAPLDPWAALAAPFAPAIVELKPGAIAEEKKRALALAYVDARHYQARLDAV